jgi:hypothetical protein
MYGISPVLVHVDNPPTMANIPSYWETSHFEKMMIYDVL